MSSKGSGSKKPEGKRVDGLQMAAEILNLMKGPEREKLLANLKKTNPQITERIEDRMFVFEDLNRVNPKGLQEILRLIPQPTLLLALRNAPDSLREKIFDSFVPRLSQILREDYRNQKPRLLSEVKKAQEELMGVARKLLAEGKIVLEKER